MNRSWIVARSLAALSMALVSILLTNRMRGAEDVTYPAATPPAKTWPIEVILSAEYQALCKVLVGDEMPAMSLVDLEGKETTLAATFGKKLTVVVFWKLDHLYAKEQFTRLEREVADAFAAQGVKAVAIAVAEDSEAVRALAEECGCDFPCLLDADGAQFAKVASGKLPRTYLCDSGGKILWMDLEYSVSTRRGLTNAIWRSLGKK